MATQLGQLLIDSARRFPSRPALHLAGEVVSYQQLCSSSAVIAVALQQLTTAIEGEVRCALAIAKTVNGYCSIIATQLANQCWIPLNAAFPVARNLAILAQSKPQVLLLTPEFSAQAEPLINGLSYGVILLFVGWQALPEWAPDNAVLLESEQISQGTEVALCHRDCSLAYIMFTSGSTGSPKGVAVSQANVIAYLNRMDALYQPNQQDRFSQFFEFTFDLSVHDLFVCWQAGGCLYPAGLVDNLMPTAYVRRHQLTYWFSVPTMGASLHSLGQLKPGTMESLTHVLFCGEALPVDVARGFQLGAPNAVVDNLYGPTEATIAFSYQRLGEPSDTDKGIVAIGKPFDGLEVAVVDANFILCRTGVKGELWLSGDQLAVGYWQRPQLEAEVFIDLTLEGKVGQRWYRSGDLASIDAQGNIGFYGRMDNQIKIRGYRIELQEVEQVVMAATGVSSVAAIEVYESQTPGTSASAIRLFAVAPDSDVDTLMAQCREHLPSYMQPDELIWKRHNFSFKRL